MEAIYQYKTDIKNGTKVVIFGCFGTAIEFALRLIMQDIHFDFFSFFSNKRYALPHLMNKKVLDVAQLKTLDDYIVIVSWKEAEYAYNVLKEYGLEERLRNIETIHDNLMNSSNLIIYGTGGRANRLFRDIGEQLRINSFCDSNMDKTGNIFNKKNVVHISELAEMPLDTCVIIGSTFYNEIKEKLLQYGLKESQIYYTEYDLAFFSDNKHKFTYKISSILDIIRDCYNKKVILYGEKNTTHIMSIYFSHFNIEVEKLERNSFEEDGTVFSLAYYDKDDSICIILDQYSEATLNALVNIGLKKLQYVWLEDYSSYSLNYSKQRCNCVLDPHLGFTYKANEREEYSGFVKYEYICGKGKPIVIVTLGGSTTTGYGIRQKSWPECLSELLTIKGKEHIIYNGGCDSYRASQELIKLIRDGIWIKPDYVISYSGANNMPPDSNTDLDFKTPFVHYYQREFYDNIVNYAKVFSPWGKMNNVNYGIERDYDSFEFWYTQIKMMHAVCNDFEIKYNAFLQPVLYNKADIKGQDRNIILLDGFLCLGNSIEAVEASGRYKIYQKNALHYRQAAKNIDEPWFHDLSDLFDNYDGIYMDNCHVYEIGNRIIAQRIYKTIKDFV